MARKGSKRKEKEVKASWLYQCPKWPVYETLLSLAWEAEEELASILVARQSPRSGKIAAAAFLVDLQCMGVKTSFVRISKDPNDYQRRLREPLFRDQYMEKASFDLVAKIVLEGVAYAESLGFTPDPEYNQARMLLESANPDACEIEVPLGGKDGRPLLMPGPNDDVEQIIATLTRTVGEDGFEYREV